jgi:hypothetical protein
MNRMVKAGDVGRLVEAKAPQSSRECLEDILAEASERLVAMVGRSELLRAVEGEVAATLRTHGIEPIVLKGTSFADRLYADASLRPFTDIDILVPEAAMPDVRRSLAASGLIPTPEVSRRHAGGYAEERWTHPVLEGTLIELHWDLVSSPTMRKAVSLTYEDLLPLIGSDGRLSASALLLVAAIHGTAGHGFELLQHVIDVAQAARGAAGAIEAHEILLTAKGKGQRLAVEAALLTAALILSDKDCTTLALSIDARPSAWWLSRLLGVATVVEARGPHHSRMSWRRQLYRAAFIRLAVNL